MQAIDAAHLRCRKASLVDISNAATQSDDRRVIGTELARRAFTPRTDEWLRANEWEQRVTKWFYAEINCFNQNGIQAPPWRE
jgi:hypothetical protein